MLGVVRLGHLGRDGPELGRHDAQLLALQAAEDLAGQPALDAVGLHDDKGAVHERWTLHNPGRRPAATVRRERPDVGARQRPASSQGTDDARASAGAVPTT